MKIQDAIIGMTVTYKGHTTGKIVQIGNATRETVQKCNQPYEIIYMQPDGCIAPGGLLGDVAENFKEVGSNSEPVNKICPHLKGPCLLTGCLACDMTCHNSQFDENGMVTKITSKWACTALGVTIQARIDDVTHG